MTDNDHGDHDISSQENYDKKNPQTMQYNHSRSYTQTYQEQGLQTHFLTKKARNLMMFYTQSC